MLEKYIWITLISVLMMLSFNAAAEGPVVDPTITPTMTLTCNYPIEREDGTPLAVDEIAKVNFFVSTSLTTPNWQPAGSNDTECKQVYDLSNVPDNQYYYTGTTVDTDVRESIYGADAVPPEYFALVVKRLANPKHQTGYGATFN